MPRSRATCAIGRPVSRTSRTAPSLKSRSNFRRVSAIAPPHLRRCVHDKRGNPDLSIAWRWSGREALATAPAEGQLPTLWRTAILIHPGATRRAHQILNLAPRRATYLTPENRRPGPGVRGGAPGDPRDTAKAGLPEVRHEARVRLCDGRRFTAIPGQSG